MISLQYISRDKISNKSIGLVEPSGLAISKENGELWVVSDDTPAVFRFQPDDPGNVTVMPVREKEMEGITLVESDDVFFVINENKGRISRFSISGGKSRYRQVISKMKGYPDFGEIVEAAGKQSGIEGITWHSERRNLFVVVEGPPGLLLEISPDLQTILSLTELSAKRGFADPDDAEIKVDFSDVCYDVTRDKLWILSDRAARVFVYDLTAGRVVESLPLTWENSKGRRKTVDKPEGLVLSPDGNQLFVVSDSEARLYRWKIENGSHYNGN